MLVYTLSAGKVRPDRLGLLNLSTSYSCLYLMTINGE